MIIHLDAFICYCDVFLHQTSTEIWVFHLIAAALLGTVCWCISPIRSIHFGFIGDISATDLIHGQTNLVFAKLCTNKDRALDAQAYSCMTEWSKVVVFMKILDKFFIAFLQIAFVIK